MIKRVLILIGGTSGEHEISLISGKHVLEAIDRELFDPLVIVIQKDGVMTLVDEDVVKGLSDNPKKIETPPGDVAVIRPYKFNGENFIVTDDDEYVYDVAFPVLHGPGGEDGTIQGVFELAQVPLVGCGVKASATCMDKGLTKKVCAEAGLPVVPFIEVYNGKFELSSINWSFPMFVKPANLGSSIGVFKATNEDELSDAVSKAQKLDSKVLIEPAIDGRELELAILGNTESLMVSPAGEIRCGEGFYDYHSKYLEPHSAELIAPAKVDEKVLQRLRDISKRAFEVLGCSGMARIDFFLSERGEVLINEVNTIPGFTPISMYPRLMQLTGMSYSELITKLIQMAV